MGKDAAPRESAALVETRAAGRDAFPDEVAAQGETAFAAEVPDGVPEQDEFLWVEESDEIRFLRVRPAWTRAEVPVWGVIPCAAQETGDSPFGAWAPDVSPFAAVLLERVWILNDWEQFLSQVQFSTPEYVPLFVQEQTRQVAPLLPCVRLPQVAPRQGYADDRRSLLQRMSDRRVRPGFAVSGSGLGPCGACPLPFAPPVLVHDECHLDRR